MATFTLTDNNDDFTGSSGDDTIFSLGGNDRVHGGGGNDTIDGGSGDDNLFGDSGNDILTGGPGADTLTGGPGADTFRDTAAGLNGDHITDFLPGDRIQITDLNVQSAMIGVNANSITFNGNSVTVDGLGAGRLVVRGIDAGGVEIRLQHDAINDFNGDGRSDILWRNDSGALSVWLGAANGGFINNDAHSATSMSVNWHVAGTGDFNGDGIVDVLWRSIDTGAVKDWLGTASGGFTSNDSNSSASAALNWSVAGIGDFNGDGLSDILWRNSSGAMSDWLGTTNGGFLHNDANASSFAPTNWQVVGTGDFNGDGKDDILWRSDTGALSSWLGTDSGGFANNDSNAATWAPTNWTVVGTGDFNGDGLGDILWRSDTGALSDWLGTASGGFINNDAHAAGWAPTDWVVAAIGDFNGDTIDDILWRNSTTGHMSDWVANSNGGFSNNDANAANWADTSWHIQADPFHA